MKYFKYSIIGLVLPGIILFSWLWSGVTVPDSVQAEKISCDVDAPPLDLSRDFKVLNYNVQYMASKNYVFFYDVVDGPDDKPTKEHVLWTIDRVADVINKESPDIILLQEVADNDIRSHYTDQIKMLRAKLTTDYPCVSHADYMRMRFFPHPSFLGSTGLKLTVLSRYPIVNATRHQLPLKDNNPVTQHFYFHRAVQEIEIQTIAAQKNLKIFNTHLDAWAGGTDLMDKQVSFIESLLTKQNELKHPWVLGGDFNLLPPDGGQQYKQLTAKATGVYSKVTAIEPLYKSYQAIPPLAQLRTENRDKWYTHFPNKPAVTKPDRTLDYLFNSDALRISNAYVRQKDTLDISDHLPMIGIYRKN